MCDAVGIQTAGSFSFQREGGVGVRCIDGDEEWWGCAQMQCVDETRGGNGEANKFDLASDASLYERARKSAL